jgi:hypothetical protein
MKSFSSPESELRIRLAARKLPYLTYRKLADWLGVYEYVPPESRKLYTKLIVIPHYASELYALWRWLDYIEFTLYLDEQECLHQLIQESETSHTLPS